MNHNHVTREGAGWVLRVLLIVATGFGLAACGSADNEQSMSADESEATGAGPGRVDYSDMTGESAYTLVCASCHESGADGAPAVGNREAWVGRSPLWEAVLVEHAKDGYLDMPSKGGAQDLPDSVVSRATEYMMLLVYPDRPPDN